VPAMTICKPLGVSLLASTLLLVAGCSPPLHISSNGDVATIDVQTLGEYPSDVSSVMVTNEQSGTLVWHLVPDRADRFQIHTLTIRVGANSTRPSVSSGNVRSQVPAQQRFFVIDPGVRYRVYVCAPGWYGRCRSSEFKLHRSARIDSPRQDSIVAYLDFPRDSDHRFHLTSR
jgi:hypothetical protein